MGWRSPRAGIGLLRWEPLRLELASRDCGGDPNLIEAPWLADSRVLDESGTLSMGGLACFPSRLD